MYFESPAFEPAQDHLIAWVGDLTTEQLRAYLEEPGGLGDNEPISEFSRDLGRWYDHDHVWARASDTPVTIEKLAEANFIDDETLISELAGRTARASVGKVRAFIILWNAKLTQLQPHSIAGGRLFCVGFWGHDSPLADD